MLEILPDHLCSLSEDATTRLYNKKVFKEYTTPGSLACNMQSALLTYAPDLAEQYANLSETDKLLVAYDVALELADAYFIYGWGN
jgi:hypothetical protein